MKEAEGIGKTYEEAVSDGLKKIGLSKKDVDIELLKEPKKTFFSILDPRQVKVKITEKEHKEEAVKEHVEKVYEKPSDEDKKGAEEIVESFIKDYLNALGIDLNVDIKEDNDIIKVELTGEKAGLIIGYRGETLEALQVLVANIANKNRETRVRVIVDAENYRKKRDKTLEELAQKVANTVVSKRKSITLEPMVAFERKVIHETLQNHPKVKTLSVGEEPYRKVVISLK